MRKSLIMLGVLAVLALVSMPVWAASTSLSDNDLSAISGKDVAIVDDNAGGGVGCGGCIQYGLYSWTDTHAADVSDHKGANDAHGDTNTVQQNVVANDNFISWGAYATTRLTATGVSGAIGAVGIDVETWATQDVGGF
jgi:hypothetical protein